MTRHANRRGVLLMLAGGACFVTNAALVKLDSEIMPVFQVIFVQAACTTAFLLAAAAVIRVPIRGSFVSNGRVLLRSALDALSMIVWVIGLAHLPMANASAIYMSTPLIVTVLAVSMLGERVTAAMWLAIIVGFAGVLLVVQPAGDKFTIWSLFILLSAILVATRDLVTRWIGKSVSSLVLTLIAAVMLMICAAAGSAIQGWRPISTAEFGILATGSAFLSSSYFLLTVALREGDLSVVGPFRYFSLIFSAILGFVIWGDIPGSVALCGMALTICAGLYLLRNGHARSRSLMSPLRSGR
jgi:drug/metabolite transporter (DMT)-like permease